MPRFNNSSLLGGYSNLSAVKGSPKLGTINFWSASLATHSKKRKKLASSKANASMIRGNFLPQKATGTTSRKKLKDVSELTYKASTTKANTVKSSNKKNVTPKKASTSTPKQDKLFGGKGWGLTEKAQKKLPKMLQKLGVGQTEKTVTIMGKKLTFKAPDPRKKKVNPVTGFVSYG